MMARKPEPIKDKHDKIRLLFLALMFAVLTASGATSYYGHTEEAWNRLSKAEKFR